MANPTTGFGLRPVRRLDAAGLSFQVEQREIAYNNANTIGTGDLCTSLASGYIDKYTAGDTITAGVFIGCRYLNPTLGYDWFFPIWNAPSLPSTTKVYALLIADPNVVFEARTSGGASAVGVADIGANFELVVGTPNALTGQSTTTIDDATGPATTATYPVKMVNTAPTVNSNFNDNSLVNNIIEVRLNTLNLYTAAGITA